MKNDYCFFLFKLFFKANVNELKNDSLSEKKIRVTNYFHLRRTFLIFNCNIKNYIKTAIYQSNEKRKLFFVVIILFFSTF